MEHEGPHTKQLLTALYVLITLGFIGVLAAHLTDNSELDVLIFFGTAGLSFLMALWIRHDARVYALTAKVKLELDPRAPIVYLRPFTIDSEQIGDVTMGMSAPWETPRVTYESMIVQSLSRLGPVIAIADPKEKLPPIGAARMQARDDEWEGTVLDLLSKAQIVVIRPGTTKGIETELKHAFGKTRPERLMLLLPRAEFLSRASDRKQRTEKLNLCRSAAEGSNVRSLPPTPLNWEILVFDRSGNPIPIWNPWLPHRMFQIVVSLRRAVAVIRANTQPTANPTASPTT